MKQEEVRVYHEFGPLYDAKSEILIMGSFPSVKSREQQFYYGHPQNRFWKVLAALYDVKPLQTIDEKKAFLLEHHIALWDVIESCVITGSSDSSIREVKVNDIAGIVSKSNIHSIYANGTKAYELYTKYTYPTTQIEAVKLPSTSPANAAWNMERLLAAWQVIWHK